jgi:hypothetical protein
MKRLVLVLVLAGVLVALLAAASASGNPGSNNKQVQYRRFSCDNGNTYNAGFVGVAPGNFFLVDSTSVFAIKVFTEVFPSGEVKTFNYGISGFDLSTLVTCSYVDPQGILNIFSGFLTPRS